MGNFLYYTFLYTPTPILEAMMSVAGYLKSMCEILRHFRLPVVMLEGYRMNYPVKAVWVGTDEMKPYILDNLYGGNYRSIRMENMTLIDFRSQLKRCEQQYDIIFLELNNLLPPMGGFKRIKKELYTTMRVIDRRRGPYNRINRLIEKSNITFKVFKVSKNVDQLRVFYDELYVPHISVAYGEGYVESFDSMKSFYPKGWLRLGYLKGEPIAGTLFLFRGDILVSCKYGVRDPKNKVHRAAASTYSQLKYAEEMGFNHYHGFHTKPFLSDGLTAHKRSCGLGVQIEKRNYYFNKDTYLRIVNFSPGVIDFLSKEPFVFVSEGQLVASITCPIGNSSLVDEVVRQYRRYRTRGIASYEINLKRELSAQEKSEIFQRCHQSDSEKLIVFNTYGRIKHSLRRSVNEG
ncbi:MAG: hypothetical protein ACQ9IQ_10915 [Nitrospirales bacterium]